MSAPMVICSVCAVLTEKFKTSMCGGCGWSARICADCDGKVWPQTGRTMATVVMLRHQQDCPKTLSLHWQRKGGTK